jgi:23S rRNA-/tRNA-specific pseudouridylate synthase
MATCGRCQREIIWAWSEEDHALVAVDKLAGLATVAASTSFKLDFEAADHRPAAARVKRPDVWPGHRLHDETCGAGTRL